MWVCGLVSSLACGSYRAPVETWPKVLAFLDRHTDRVRGLISHRSPLADAVAAIDLAGAKQAFPGGELPKWDFHFKSKKAQQCLTVRGRDWGRTRGA